MRYPKQLEPTTLERIELPSGKVVTIPKATPVFEPWVGRKIRDTYNGKPVLQFLRKPQFAELIILRIFEREGWKGVWVDTYRNAFRTRYWPKNSVKLPDKQQLLCDRVRKTADSRAGQWDVFCWKRDSYVFVESKYRGKDHIRDTQRQWLQAAIKCGVQRESLLIVEWSLLQQKP